MDLLRALRGVHARKYIICIFAAALVIRLVLFWSLIPAADGLHWYGTARYVSRYGFVPLSLNRQVYGVYRAPLSSLFLGLGMSIGGEMGADFVLALASSLAVFPLFLVFEKIFSGRIALVSVALWAINPVEVIHGSSGYVEGVLVLFGTLGVYFLLRGVMDEPDSYKPWILAGILFGLAGLSKRSGLVYLPFVLLLLLGYRWLAGKLISLKGAAIALSLFIGVSSVWLVHISMIGEVRNPVIDPSTITETDSSIGGFVRNLIGLYYELNGFYIGGLASGWWARYPLLMAVWLAATIGIVVCSLVGLRIAVHKPYAQILTGAALVASFAFLAYVEWRSGILFTPESFRTTHARWMFPLLVLVIPMFPMGLTVFSRAKSVGSLLVLALLLCPVVIFGMACTHIFSRTNLLSFEADQLKEVSMMMPDSTRVFAEDPLAKFYYLFPREIYGIGDVDQLQLGSDPLRVLRELNIEYVYFSDGLFHDEFNGTQMVELGFPVIYSSQIEVLGLSGRHVSVLRSWLLEVPYES